MLHLSLARSVQFSLKPKPNFSAYNPPKDKTPPPIPGPEDNVEKLPTGRRDEGLKPSTTKAERDAFLADPADCKGVIGPTGGKQGKSK